MIDEAYLNEKVLTAIGEVAGIFTTDERRGVDIVMPTEDLVRISNNLQASIRIGIGMKLVTQELLNDADYRRAWEDNISVCYQDELRHHLEDKSIRDICDNAASKFIDLLVRDSGKQD